MSLPLALRPYQAETLNAIAAAAERGVTRQLVALPTGAGKTIVFSHLLADRPGRSLVLAHREELLTQAADKLSRVAPQLGIGIVQAQRNEYRYPVVVASVPTLAQPRRLAQVGTDFQTVVCDEAHHFAAHSFYELLDNLGAFGEHGPLVVGFTATPDRGDRVGLGEVFQEIVYSRDLVAMIRDGYLCDIRAERIELAVDLRALKVQHGDLADGELGQVLMDADAPRHVAAAYVERASGRKALLFTPTVLMADACAQALQERGVRAAYVSGETPREQRRDLLQRFSRGDLDVLVNCMVLTEGYDEPSVDCVIVARPTKSRPLYQQMVGRGTRLYPGKSDLLVLDVVGVTERHDLVTPASLLGLPRDSLKGKSVTEAMAQAEQTAFSLSAASDAYSGQLKAHQVDVLTSRLRWLKTGGVWVLSAGDRSIAMRETRDGWGVWERSRGQQDWTSLAKGLDMGYAQGVAEDRARTVGAAGLLQTDAPWRDRPATDKQLVALRKWGVVAREGMTAGEASDALTMAANRKKVPA